MCGLLEEQGRVTLDRIQDLGGLHLRVAGRFFFPLFGKCPEVPRAGVQPAKTTPWVMSLAVNGLSCELPTTMQFTAGKEEKPYWKSSMCSPPA